MSKKLTKAECERAVECMYPKTDWPDKVDAAKKVFYDYALELLKKYIPQDIWDMAKKHQDTLVRADGIRFYRQTEDSYHASTWVGFYHYRNYSEDRRTYEEGVVLPELKNLGISGDEYKKLDNLGRDKNKTEATALRWKKDTAEALYKLNSRTRIQEAFPEALPYLCFDIPQNCAIQVHNYDSLRACFKKD